MHREGASFYSGTVPEIRTERNPFREKIELLAQFAPALPKATTADDDSWRMEGEALARSRSAQERFDRRFTTPKFDRLQRDLKIIAGTYALSQIGLVALVAAGAISFPVFIGGIVVFTAAGLGYIAFNQGQINTIEKRTDVMADRVGKRIANAVKRDYERQR